MSAWEGWQVNKTYHWRRKLPNGWTALVSDFSREAAPPQPTKYVASAVNKKQVIQARGTFDSLEDARDEALSLALSQQQ